jgi:hypothetical protein
VEKYVWMWIKFGQSADAKHIYAISRVEAGCFPPQAAKLLFVPGDCAMMMNTKRMRKVM